jgi:hypothetical protein
MLAGLAGVASTSQGAQKLDQMVANTDDSILGNLGSFLDRSDTSSMIERGTGMLGTLFGGDGTVSALANALANFTGLGSGAIGKLLGFLSPVILGIFKQQKSSLGLDGGGLANLLTSQKQNIAAAMPPGLAGVLANAPGLGGLGDMARNFLGSAGQTTQAAGNVAGQYGRQAAASVQSAANEAGQYGRRAAATAPSSLKWVVPIGALALLGLVLWRFVSPAADSVPRRAQAVDATGTAPSAGTAGERVSTIKNEMTSIFKSTTEVMTGIKDSASAEAAIPQLRELSVQIDGVQKMFDDLPAGAKSTVNSFAKTSLATLQPLIDKAMAIPEVDEKLRDIVDPMLLKLKVLAGVA